MDDTALVAACGLYCGACPHYRCTLEDGEHLRFDSEGNPTVPCDGCRSQRLTPWCGKCLLRLCANALHQVGCEECRDFPCAAFVDFEAVGAHTATERHRNDIYKQLARLQEVGPQAWLAEQRALWTCECGAPYTFYETQCHVCGRPLSSYATDRGLD